MPLSIPNNYRFTYPWLPVTDTNEVVCVLCKGAHETEEAFAFLVNDKSFSIIRCIHDDLMFLSPQPGNAYTAALYNHPSYFTGEDDMYGLSVSDEKSTEVAIIRIKEIDEYLKKSGTGLARKSLLEIGCAYGHTLLEAKNFGAEIVRGIEFSREAVGACYSKGLNVFLASANNDMGTVLDHTSFDVIALYSALEHVDDPADFLSRIRPLLAPQGIVVIRVPETTTDGTWLSLIDHFWHFTRKSLTSLLEQHGFAVLNLFPSGVFHGTIHPGALGSITAIARRKDQ
jgi:SAM-dependent methyltransferase